MDELFLGDPDQFADFRSKVDNSEDGQLPAELSSIEDLLPSCDSLDSGLSSQGELHKVAA